MKMVTSDALSIEIPSAHRRRGCPPGPDAPTRKTSRTGDGKLAGRETFEEGLGLTVCNVRSRVLVVIIFPRHLVLAWGKVLAQGRLHPEYEGLILLDSPKDQRKGNERLQIHVCFSLVSSP